MGFTTPPVAGAAARALYLQARSLWNERTAASIREAIRHLERAIVLDGRFPLASAALADCFSLLIDYALVSPREALTAARLAAGRALHQGPHLPESLTAAALVRQMDLDWKGAETEFQTAIRVHPGHAPARQRYALLLAAMGRFPQARREIRRALDLDPHTPAISASASWVEYYAGRFPRAIQTAEMTLARYPGFVAARAAMASALIQEERAPEAGFVLESSLTLEPGNPSLLSLLAFARAREGKKMEAEDVLGRVRDAGSARYVSPYHLSVALLGTGREEEALRALEGAESEGAPQLAHLAVDPLFSPLRGRPRFVALLKRIGVHRPRSARGSSPAPTLAAPPWPEGAGFAGHGTPSSTVDAREEVA